MVDFSLNKNTVVVSNDIDLVLQQIDLLFDSYKGEVFGDDGFGTDYERLLYDLQLSNDAISTQVNIDLNKLDLRGFIPTVNVYLFQGTEQDISLVDIILQRNSETYNKTYRIS